MIHKNRITAVPNITKSFRTTIDIVCNALRSNALLKMKFIIFFIVIEDSIENVREDESELSRH